MSATELGLDLPAVTTAVHNVSTLDAPGGKAIRCDNCGFKAEGYLFGAKEALRLAYGHVYSPDCTVLELLQGPPCAKRGVA